MNHNQPLRIKVQDGLFVISIGIKTLAYCQQSVIDNDDYSEKETVKIVDPMQFARDIEGELEDEREDGSTILTDLLDLASRRAIENGSVAIETVKKKPDTWLNLADGML